MDEISLSLALIRSAVACIKAPEYPYPADMHRKRNYFLFDSFIFLMIILIFLEYIFYIINLVFSFSSDNINNIEQSIGFEQSSFLTT